MIHEIPHAHTLKKKITRPLLFFFFRHSLRQFQSLNFTTTQIQNVSFGKGENESEDRHGPAKAGRDGAVPGVGVDHVDPPAHVRVGEGVVVDDVGPRGVRRDLQYAGVSCSLIFFRFIR